jgi:hypothetical protein
MMREASDQLFPIIPAERDRYLTCHANSAAELELMQEIMTATGDLRGRDGRMIRSPLSKGAASQLGAWLWRAGYRKSR